MTHPFSLAGRSFAAPTPNLPLPHVTRTLFVPYLPLCDGAVARLVLSNHLPVRNSVRVRLYNVRDGLIPVRWVGPHAQADLTFRLDPFVTRFIEVDGADCPDSFQAWAQVEMTALGTTGYTLTTNPADPGSSMYQPMLDGTETCVRFPFDCEGGRVTHYSLINLGTKENEVREFTFQFFFANAPKAEHLLVKVPAGHAVSVVPEMLEIRDQSGVVAIRGLDDEAGFLVAGFWFHPGGQRGILPTLPATGSRV